MSQSVTILIPSDMDQAIRLAQVMATSRMVPKHLQSDEGTCLMIIEQALRWGMSPFAVAQCTSSIGGKLMFEGKLVAAAVQSSGAIEGHFDYVFDGDGDDRRVTVSAKRRGETNPRQMTIRLRDVRTNNEWWRRQPDQMLVYSGTRNWARRFTPAAILGIYSPEEFDRKTGTIITDEGPIVEHEPPRSHVQQPLPTMQTERVVDPTVYDTPPKSTPVARTDDQWRAWLVKLRDAVGVLRYRSEVEDVAAKDTVGSALASGPNWVRREIDSILADAFARFPEEPDELPEVVIAGEENMASG